MEKWGGSDLCLKTTGPACEHSKEFLLNVEDVNFNVLNGSLRPCASWLVTVTSTILNFTLHNHDTFRSV